MLRFAIAALLRFTIGAIGLTLVIGSPLLGEYWTSHPPADWLQPSIHGYVNGALMPALFVIWLFGAGLIAAVAASLKP